MVRIIITYNCPDYRCETYFVNDMETATLIANYFRKHKGISEIEISSKEVTPLSFEDCKDVIIYDMTYHTVFDENDIVQ